MTSDRTENRSRYVKTRWMGNWMKVEGSSDLYRTEISCQRPTCMRTTSSGTGQASITESCPEVTQQVHPILPGLLDFYPHIFMGLSIPLVRKWHCVSFIRVSGLRAIVKPDGTGILIPAVGSGRWDMEGLNHQKRLFQVEVIICFLGDAKWRGF